MGVVGSLPWIIPLGAYAGYLTFGFIADLIGRRQAFVFYMVAALLVPILARWRAAHRSYSRSDH